jgi:hypothetical protein
MDSHRESDKEYLVNTPGGTKYLAVDAVNADKRVNVKTSLFSRKAYSKLLAFSLVQFF